MRAGVVKLFLSSTFQALSEVILFMMACMDSAWASSERAKTCSNASTEASVASAPELPPLEACAEKKSKAVTRRDTFDIALQLRNFFTKQMVSTLSLESTVQSYCAKLTV